MARPEPPRILPRKRLDHSGAQTRKQTIAACLFLLLGSSLIITGCGGYTSQADKYLSQGRSQVLGASYTLERFGDGEVSGPFLRASLQQDAKAMKSTARSISSLKPPPDAKEAHRRQVAAISRAQSLVLGVGKSGVGSKRAPELAHKLKGIAKELRL